MPQRDVEVILARQLASYLVTPVFLVDAEGNLIFYNEAAERLLGARYEETGEMPTREWATAFRPTDDQGAPIAAEALPLAVALAERRPVHGALRIMGLDGVARRLQVTAIPLLAQSERFLGAVALFWETP